MITLPVNDLAGIRTQGLYHTPELLAAVQYWLLVAASDKTENSNF